MFLIAVMRCNVSISNLELVLMYINSNSLANGQDA
jgi:hypothetical protein